jgi:hypothetical protein
MVQISRMAGVARNMRIRHCTSLLPGGGRFRFIISSGTVKARKTERYASTITKVSQGLNQVCMNMNKKTLGYNE